MAKTTNPKEIVLVDDELHNVLWIADYFESKGFVVHTAENVNEALKVIEGKIFRALIVDLNIPVLEPLTNVIARAGKEYEMFPGLYVAERARNFGYRGRQVLLYSVHRDPAVAQIANRIGITYIMKGRPHEVKVELESVVSFDPTAPDS